MTQVSKGVQLLDIGDGMKIPVDAVTQTFAILGKRGRGKTSTAKVLAEEMIQAGQQVIIMDTVGAWWGLRSSPDGKAPGLPVVVFGGSHADVPLEDNAGSVIARTLMQHRMPAVIDLSGFRKAAQRRFATAFIEELYHSNREPMHVVFDEADEFAPQNPMQEGRQLLAAMEDFVRRGRLRGLGCTLVSQRPAVIHKDVLTQVEVLITMGLTGPRDVSAIDEWIRLHADDDQAKTVRGSLASLPVGTAWVWSPEWLETLRKVRVRRIGTFDSSATPKVGQKTFQPTVRAQIDLEALGAQIAETVEKAKADDPKALRGRIVQLERQLASKAPVPEPVQVTIEVPVLTDRDRDALAEQTSKLGELADALIHEGTAIAELLHRLEAALKQPHVSEPAVVSVNKAEQALPRLAPLPRRGEREQQPTTTGAETPRLSKMEKAIASALAAHGTLSARQVGLFTGYAHKSGSFANSLSKLRAAGLIQGTGSAMAITDGGLAALELAGGYDPLPTGRALVDWWLAKLPKAQAAMLEELLQVWPRPLTLAELGERTGYSPGSGSFANNRSKLNVAELITGDRNALYAADTLGEAFTEGAG